MDLNFTKLKKDLIKGMETAKLRLTYLLTCVSEKPLTEEDFDKSFSNKDIGSMFVVAAFKKVYLGLDHEDQKILIKSALVRHSDDSQIDIILNGFEEAFSNIESIIGNVGTTERELIYSIGIEFSKIANIFVFNLIKMVEDIEPDLFKRIVLSLLDGGINSDAILKIYFDHLDDKIETTKKELSGLEDKDLHKKLIEYVLQNDTISVRILMDILNERGINPPTDGL